MELINCVFESIYQFISELNLPNKPKVKVFYTLEVWFEENTYPNLNSNIVNEYQKSYCQLKI